MKQVGKLNPFGRFCCTIGNLPTSYMESLTYEEQLLWFCKFLDTEVIPAVNENAEAIIELQNYLKNLDLQDYVDNKLDEMAESGQLTDIIAQYLQLAGLLCFNTKADLKAAQNLVDGSFAKTFGTSTYNDGYGYFYKIRTLINTDVIDDDNLLALTEYPTLVAEKIPDATINGLVTDVTNIKANLDDLNNKNYRKMILIGDSFCEQNSDGDITKFFWEYLRDALGLTQNNNFYASYQSGAGFGNQLFLTKLQDLDNTITDKDSITDILVCGGWNDSDINQPYGTDAAYASGVAAFKAYVDTNYPNAQVSIAHISWGMPSVIGDNSVWLQMPVSFNRYNNTCGEYGWRFLNGVKNILHIYDSTYWQTNGSHPSQLGQTLLGNSLSTAFLTGTASVYRLNTSTLTPSGKATAWSNTSITTSISDNAISCELNPTGLGVYITIGDSMVLDGGTIYELGTINSRDIQGYGGYNLTTIPMYATGTFNGVSSTYEGMAEIWIENNKIKTRMTAFSGGSRIETFTCDYLWIPCFKIIGDTMTA